MDEQSFPVPERRRYGSSWVNVLLGIWVIISPFVFGMNVKGIWNNVTVGALVGILAILRWSMRQPGWSWVNLMLGAWLVISPFVRFLGIAAMWNNVAVGIVIAALALTNTYSKTTTAVGI